MNYEMESPWMQLGGKISKKRTKIIWAQNMYGTRFTQLRSKRRTKPSAAEQATREKFKQATTQTNLIMTDVDQLEPYRQMWKAKILAGYKTQKTLRGFIFAQIYRTL